MNPKSKSYKCLKACHEAFLSGESTAAIKNLNITFNHATNKDWSGGDTKSILNFLSWLYFYEQRFEQAADLLERSAVHIRKTAGSDDKNLPLLHYNLAELYWKMDQADKCESNFLLSMDLLEVTLGVNSRSYRLVLERYFEVCKSPPPATEQSAAFKGRKHLRLIDNDSSVHALALRSI